MAETPDYKSILAADFGSVNTRLVLIDRVDGAYRLVARATTRTTADDPLRNVSIGLNRALQELSERTGRELLDGLDLIKPERPNGAGVDLLLATASAGRPLRVALVGLMPEISLASGQFVLDGSYVEVVDILSAADLLSHEARLNRLLRHHPDLIALVGGTDAGAEAPILAAVDLVRDAVRVAPRPPLVLYAGNRALQAAVQERLGEDTRLYLADNVRPGLEHEQVGPAQMELAAAYDEFRITAGGGFEDIGAITNMRILPTAQSFTNIARYLGAVKRRETAGVLALDVGSGTTTAAAAIQQEPYVSIRTDIGLGHSAANLLAATTPGNLRRWLTFDASDARLADYVYNKTLRPATVPMNARDLELEHALAREAMRITVAQVRDRWRETHPADPMPTLSPVIGAGAVLTNAPHPGLAALLLLDALQPTGQLELWLDPAGLIPALGALAYAVPAAVVQMLEAGDLTQLGTVLCVDGQPSLGKGNIRVRVTPAAGQPITQHLSGGMIWTCAIPPGQTAEVQVTLARGLSIGGKRRLKLTVTGSAAGLIIDARGRPLPLLQDAEARAQLYAAWQAGAQGESVTDLDVDWSALAGAARAEEETASVAAPVADEAASAPDAPRQRRGLFGRRRRREAEAEDDEFADLEPVGADLGDFDLDDFVVDTPPAAPAADIDEPDIMLDETAVDLEPDMIDEMREATTGKQRRRGLFRR